MPLSSVSLSVFFFVFIEVDAFSRPFGYKVTHMLIRPACDPAGECAPLHRAPPGASALLHNCLSCVPFVYFLSFFYLVLFSETSRLSGEMLRAAH